MLLLLFVLFFVFVLMNGGDSCCLIVFGAEWFLIEFICLFKLQMSLNTV